MSATKGLTVLGAAPKTKGGDIDSHARAYSSEPRPHPPPTPQIHVGSPTQLYTYCFTHPSITAGDRLEIGWRSVAARLAHSVHPLKILTSTLVGGTPLSFDSPVYKVRFLEHPPSLFPWVPYPTGGIYFCHRMAGIPSAPSLFTLPYSRTYKARLHPSNRTLHRHAYC